MVVSLFVLLAGCSAARTPPRHDVAAPPAPVQGAPPAAAIKEKGEPVIQYWNDGNYLAHIKPYPLMAAWGDGTVVCRVHGNLYVGKIDPAELKALLGRITKAGFFDPPLERGLVFPDGPSQTLRVVHDGKMRQLTHDGGYGRSQLEEIGDSASPSRQQAQDFVNMWARATVPLGEVAPETLTRYHGAIDWQLPGR
jgi:hypothetical protein